jgi:hypothetical protein
VKADMHRNQTRFTLDKGVSKANVGILCASDWLRCLEISLVSPDTEYHSWLCLAACLPYERTVKPCGELLG